MPIRESSQKDTAVVTRKSTLFLRALPSILQYIIPALIAAGALLAVNWKVFTPNPDRPVSVTLRGTVTDKLTNKPLNNVEVTAENHPDIDRRRTDDSGYFAMTVRLARSSQSKNINLLFTRNGYISARILVSFTDRDMSDSFELTPDHSSPEQTSRSTVIQSSRFQIGNNLGFSVGGCESRGQDYTVRAWGPVDRSKPGVGGAPNGFEIEVSGNNAHGVRNIQANGPNAISFQAWADGPGSKQGLPFGGTVCVGAEGANVAVNVFAWITGKSP